ncbi:chaperone for outer membrane proteins, Skp family [Parasphingorhabdus marina DSM 22363]|uniref:Chaperone for outer membrane proteins, Skp family n=1 Tax=Parasphingorhabdus marina DSM 22363 TaxID=1123272 RepID=A0A1N6GEI8_9SPHN|nr:OmpH family outer membrane protein [Parasphingorhabdus marina]SIO05945.1 chaperone for outer membrane proteins, Skp family [Parasphingorhabdus marina DSM 22363]
MKKLSKTLLKSAALAIAAVSVPAIVTAPAAAQSRTSIGMANFESAIVKSNAYQTAVNQMKTTYKSDIDATNARATALQAEIKPLVDAYNAAVQQPGATPQSVQPQAQALQAKRNSGQQELARLQQRVTLATAYVEEQVGKQLTAAIQAAMKAKNVDLVLSPQAVVAREPYVDITDDIVAELNKLVPSASITPPAGWQPGQQNQQAQQQPAATNQPTGR